MSLHIVYHLHELSRLVERVVLIGYELAQHTFLLQHEAFYGNLTRHAAKRDGAYQLLRGLRDGTEAVYQTSAEGIQFLLRCEVVEFLV